jgi:hypothetical protein
MVNPFVRFDTLLLNALRQSSHQWFVRQTYSRGDRLSMGVGDCGPKGQFCRAFLMTPYQQEQKAFQHLQALAGVSATGLHAGAILGAADPHLYLYDARLPEHLERLAKAAGGIPGFLLYAPMLDDHFKPGEELAKKIRTYISHHLSWRPDRGSDVQTDISVQYGEIFLTLRYKGQEVRVPLSDIEQ